MFAFHAFTPLSTQRLNALVIMTLYEFVVRFARVSVNIMRESNMYSTPTAEIWDVFADYVVGTPNCMALVLSSRVPEAPVKNAIEKSLASFGYPENTWAWATLFPRVGNAGENGSGLADADADAEPTGACIDPGVKLDAQALFMLVEGIDPLCLIACDSESRDVLQDAYRAEIPLDSPARVFGRRTASFADLGALLHTDENKQKAWSILKSLPRL